jgi:hypothetical protein
MDLLAIAIGFITALLGIAYPIILQITIDDKHSSERVLDLFEKNGKRLFFLYTLYTSLVLILVYIFRQPKEVDFKIDWLNKIIGNSAIILLCFCTTILIISFFGLIDLIKTFHRTSKLTAYLIKSDREKIKLNNFENFDALSDILIWSIQNQNTAIALKISRHFYTLFKDQRDFYNVGSGTGVIYPDRYYWIIYNVIQKVLNQSNNSLVFLESRTIGGIWLLGEFDTPKISEDTYSWIWKNISLAVKNDRNDLAFMHWRTAHQYIDSSLVLINPDYEYIDDKFLIKNELEVNKRIVERNRFIEFHESLGGLILFKRDFELLKKFFNYTTSTPPQYVLLPNHMTEVFNSFYKFWDPNDRNFPWISHQYSFPDLDSLNDLNLIKSWICKYIGVLYLRQFNITTNYSYQNPTEMPNFPNDIGTKRIWLKNINYFKKIINDLILEKDLLEALNFNPINERYISFLDDVEKKLKVSFEQEEINVKPKKDKIEQFYDSSKKILVSTFKDLDEIKNKSIEKPDDKFLNIYNFQGTFEIEDKGTFTENGIDHLNFDSFMAQGLASEIKRVIGNVFNFNSKIKYILNQEDLFAGIEKLKGDKESYIMVSFGLNLNYYIENLKVPNLSEISYKGIKIISFPYGSELVRNSIFILEKANLPWFIHEDIDQKYRDLYGLEIISKDYNLYASVSDLHENESLRNELEKQDRFKSMNLNKFVRQGISFITHLKFKKNINMVKIQVKNNWDNQLKANSIQEIKSIE